MDKISILVVEDEYIVANDIKHTLEYLGYSVIGIVSSGKDVPCAIRVNEIIATNLGVPEAIILPLLTNNVAPIRIPDAPTTNNTIFFVITDPCISDLSIVYSSLAS